MGTLKGPNNFASAPKQWGEVFASLLDVIKTQKTQIESLLEKTNLFEDRMKLQHQRFQDKISRMKSEMGVEAMVRDVDAAYWDLMLGQKQREAFSYKYKLDDAVSELADFRAWFDHLTSKCSDANENNSKMTALVAQKDFVWNQYKKRESDLTDQLKGKSTEVEQANEKIQKLLASMEILQSSDSEKDRTIVKLKTELEDALAEKSEKMQKLLASMEILQSSHSEKDRTIVKLKTELEDVLAKKSEEISRLSREVELVRKGKSAAVTPVLRRCSTRSHSNEGNDARNISMKRESHPSRVVEKGCRSSKRTALEPFPTSETPKLFTSGFKVPKLKNSSPNVI